MQDGMEKIVKKEIALDGHIMHYEIINDGSIEDLIERVREILTDENIL